MPVRVHFSADLILVCNSLDAGGIERVVSTLANEWSRRGRRVCVVTLHDQQRFYELDPTVHHVVVDRAGLNRAVELLRRVASRLRSEGPPRWWLLGVLASALHRVSHGRLYTTYHAFVYTFEAVLLRRVLRRVESPIVVALGTSINIITLKACRGLGRRLIISERSDPKRLSRSKKWDVLARTLYNHADLVTANTRGALRDLGEYVDAGKLAFVPNPLAPSNGRNGDDHATTAQAPIILNVGRLVSDKAQDVLLEAFAQLGDEFKGWRLALVGDGRLEEDLRGRASGLGLEGRVEWHGVVRDPYVFYRSATIFALPSRIEGTPNALLEAMSCGLPVVVSDGAPGLLELVEDGVTGLVVPVNDAAALAAALRRLARNSELRRRLGESARARVSEYDLPRALAAWETALGLTC
jgi:GalNAc-alpha-(1->4)-GalNAc-alpha-(1->3)-diNAcBac-PP-undecaprenol alpha-1,4-N-acetyl-D-galactosaminyltransferase